MQPPGPSGHDETVQAVLGEQPTCQNGGLLDQLEVVASRIEIKYQTVGPIRTVDAAQPDVNGDAAEVGQIDQVGGLLAHHVLHLPALLGQLLRPQPRRRPAGGVLLEETFGIYSPGVSHHDHRPVPDEWEHEGGDAPIVIDQVGLGVLVTREQQAVRVRDVDLDDGCTPRPLVDDAGSFFLVDRTPGHEDTMGADAF